MGPWFPSLSSGNHSIYVLGWQEDEVGSLSLLFWFLLLYLSCYNKIQTEEKQYKFWGLSSDAGLSGLNNHQS